MSHKEIPLSGGQNAASVVRIGNTVHRTKSTNHVYIHGILEYLEKVGFPYAPRFLGMDEVDRAMLSYIEGEVPREFDLNIAQKIDCIKILRAFHDVMAGSNFCKGKETVYHNDFAPWNVIIHKNNPVSLIDFDEIAPGKRIDDVAYCIWTFLELGTSKDTDNQQIKNISTLVKAYQLDKKSSLINAILKQQFRILSFRKEMAQNETDPEMRSFSKGAVQRIQKSIHWIECHKISIEKVLKNE